MNIYIYNKNKKTINNTVLLGSSQCVWDIFFDRSSQRRNSSQIIVHVHELNAGLCTESVSWMCL